MRARRWNDVGVMQWSPLHGTEENNHDRPAARETRRRAKHVMDFLFYLIRDSAIIKAKNKKTWTERLRERVELDTYTSPNDSEFILGFYMWLAEQRERRREDEITVRWGMRVRNVPPFSGGA